jgi:hypothetical protein
MPGYDLLGWIIARAKEGADGRVVTDGSRRRAGRQPMLVGLQGGGQLMATKSAAKPAARAGDRIVVESEKVGQRPREGEILDVIESDLGPNYEVRWDDGHRSSFRPKAGSARIVAKPKGKRG